MANSQLLAQFVSLSYRLCYVSFEENYLTANIRREFLM